MGCPCHFVQARTATPSHEQAPLKGPKGDVRVVVRNEGFAQPRPDRVGYEVAEKLPLFPEASRHHRKNFRNCVPGSRNTMPKPGTSNSMRTRLRAGWTRWLIRRSRICRKAGLRTCEASRLFPSLPSFRQEYNALDADGRKLADWSF
jgi:hypothetical protein